MTGFLLHILLFLAVGGLTLRVGRFDIWHGIADPFQPTFKLEALVRNTDERIISVAGHGARSATSTSTKTLWGRTAVSGISGYRKILTTSETNYTEYACQCSAFFVMDCTCSLEEWATEAGEMDGLTMTSMGISFNAYYEKVATKLIPDHAQMHFQLFHRDSGGAETQITSTLALNISLIPTNYPSRYFAGFSQDFDVDDRVVIKSLGHIKIGQVK